ncbi:hypothetical protein B0H16DRAFT_275506 [Mycena metata]|uniref:Uncharacterized protein n=1 Tax=Mycena metata TaxID=1033252 RepID=A0AAD7HQC6_9AGAR|nr:hypothetical protein B0H16DRAFT_531193 [Mycena metata]KAJ7725920.1 hypothetical protein B0H16DRAFT_275506 [Mycena metata]
MDQANIESGFSLTTVFPDHDPCFGNGNTSTLCQLPSTAMINFLNITTPDLYLLHYCANPPNDSCAFGYCSNPDVGSPAVRYSTYFTSVVSALLILYSPEELGSTFAAQILNVYSLIVAAMIAIAKHNLTKLHSVMALTLAGSPLSIYLVIYVFRTIFGDHTRLDQVFGKGQYLNRTLVILLVPLWVGILSFTALPSSVWQFAQAACDSISANNDIPGYFFIPFLVCFVVFPIEAGTIAGVFLLGWTTAIFRLRSKIWQKQNNKLFPLLRRMWRQPVDHYPFLNFCTVILGPHLIWILNTEVGLITFSPRETFSATYGQLLAIFVTVPPFISLCMLLPRMVRWFINLTWVRFLTCRRNEHLFSEVPDEESGITFKDGHGFVEAQKYETDGSEEKSDSVALKPFVLGR